MLEPVGVSTLSHSFVFDFTATLGCSVSAAQGKEPVEYKITTILGRAVLGTGCRICVSIMLASKKAGKKEGGLIVNNN